jgi:glycosyltransferase involved in cell wall biosynthesis
MTTILFPFYNLGLGGVQTKIIDLANTLVQSNHYRVILYLEEKKAFDRCSELDPRIKVIFCPALLSGYVKRRYYYLLLLLLYYYRPFATYVSLEKTSVFLLQARELLPFFPGKIVVNVDTYLKKEQIYSIRTLSRLYKTADAVVVQSRAGYEDFLSRLKVSSPPVVQIPNWVDISQKFPQRPVSRYEFIYAGRLEPQKDPLQYVRFMSFIKEKKPQAKMAIYGEGTLKKQLVLAVQKAGLTEHIHFYSTSHTIIQHLKESRFLVLFSQYEGMPLIGLEAMKYGTVLLGRNVAGIQDLIQDGATGICKSTIKEIAEEYLKISSKQSVYMSMQKMARKFLAQNFNQRRRNEVIKLLTQTTP